MSRELDSKLLLRQAITHHIRDTADEMLYWMDELEKLSSAVGALGAPAGVLVEEPSTHWADRYLTLLRHRSVAQ